MPQANTLPKIHHARAGKITDQILDQITDVATRAQEGETLSDSDAALILLSAPQICAELRQRRACMDLINDVSNDDNHVLMFPGVRDNG